MRARREREYIKNKQKTRKRRWKRTGWGKWGDSSDRCMGHPESVDALLKVDEDTLCTGSSHFQRAGIL